MSATASTDVILSEAKNPGSAGTTEILRSAQDDKPAKRLNRGGRKAITQQTMRALYAEWRKLSPGLEGEYADEREARLAWSNRTLATRHLPLGATSPKAKPNSCSRK